jgi:hypothetical protein
VPICGRDGNDEKVAKIRENPVDAGLNRANFLIPLKRGTPLTRSSFYVHLGLQIGLNFVPATIPGRPWIEGRGDKIEFFLSPKMDVRLVL